MGKKKLKPSTGQLKQIIRLQQILLVLVVFTLGVSINTYLKNNPGEVMERDIKVSSRTDKQIVLSWDNVRNAKSYTVTYKARGIGVDDWHQKTVSGSRISLEELEPGTEYTIKIHSIDDNSNTTASDKLHIATKAEQEIKCDETIIRDLNNKSFKISAKAENKLSFKSSDEKIVQVDAESGKATIKSGGEAYITVNAEESDDYMPAEKQIRFLAFDLSPKSSIQTLYTLDESNCSVLMEITGAGGASVPQGLAYSGDSFYISYGMYDTSTVVRYEIKTGNKTYSKPSVSMPHPNGFTYCEDTGLCYSVRGYGTRVVVYDPNSNEYSVMNLTNGQSGIAYDRAKKKFYGSSQTGTSVYNLDYSIETHFPNVNHSCSVSTQDCGGHDGIFIRCLSGPSSHGLNFVDLYNAETGEYLGTLDCYLSEVESAVVDDDGYLLLMANNTSSVDYIWKTPIKIEGLLK